MNTTTIPIDQELVIPNDLSAARQIQDKIEELLSAAQYSDEEIFGIKMALEEALVNAIKHGNQMNPEKTVQVHYTISHHRFDISITDEGSGFDPEDVPDPTEFENLERPCGRGLLLMRYYMTQVDFLGNGSSIKMSRVRDLSKS